MIAKRTENTGREKTSRRRRFPLIWIGIGSVVAIVVATLWLLPQNADPDEIPPDKTEKHSQAKPIPAAKSTAKERKPVVTPSKPSEEEVERKRRQEMFSRMSADEKMEYLRERIKNMPIPEASTNRLYTTGVEQAMDWIFSCEVGNPPPLLPPMSLFDQIHLAEILIMDNPILDTDSDKAAESKEMMKIAKKEFMKFIKDGGNPDEFLPYYHSQLVAAHDEYKMARQSVVEIIRNEPDIAVDYIKKVNERLSAKGIKNVEIPKKMLEAFGIDSEDFE